MKLNNKQSLMIVRPLLFTMGLILSSHALAAKTTYVTNEDFDTEISNRVDGDVAEATARDAAIGTAIATEVTDRNTAIDTAVADVLPPLPSVSSGAFVLSYCAETDSLLWSTGEIYEIGGTGPAGGIVFNVTNCGFNGLEAAPVGWYGGGADPSLAWGCYGILTGASKTAVGTGAQNTADILAGCSESGIAAEIVDDYELNGYTDWFLPSKDELNALYRQKGVVGGFASDYYWSSSEYNSLFAWLHGFYLGGQNYDGKNFTLRVRAVRAF